MALVIRFDTSTGEPVKVTEVLNLGWLLRHWQEVKVFRFVSQDPYKSVCDGILTAELALGRRNGPSNSVYVTSFASRSIMRDWLHRPVFRGLPLFMDGQEESC